MRIETPPLGLWLIGYFFFFDKYLIYYSLFPELSVSKPMEYSSAGNQYGADFPEVSFFEP